jgi:hypothetical protein
VATLVEDPCFPNFVVVRRFTKDLCSLVVDSLSLKAGDPRDKIYGLMGLADPDIIPDYSKSSSEVFIDFAACYISRGDSEILTFAGIGFESPRMNDLPSWVPDWQGIFQKPIRFQGFDSFHACADLRFTRSQFTDFKTLYFVGLSVDEVSIVDLEVGSALSKEYELFLRRNDALPKFEEHPSKLSYLQACVLTFQGGISAESANNERLDPRSDTFLSTAVAFMENMMVLYSQMKNLKSCCRETSWSASNQFLEFGRDLNLILL